MQIFKSLLLKLNYPALLKTTPRQINNFKYSLFFSTIIFISIIIIDIYYFPINFIPKIFLYLFSISPLLVVILYYIFYPIILRFRRITSCEEEIPFIASILASSIAKPIKTLMELKNSRLLYFSREIREMERIKNVLGLGELKALERLAEDHPSNKLKSFLKHILSIEYSGNPSTALSIRLNEFIRELKLDLSLVDYNISQITDVVYALYIFIPATIIGMLVMMNIDLLTLIITSYGIPIIGFLIVYVVSEYIYPKIYTANLSKRNYILILIILLLAIPIYYILNLYLKIRNTYLFIITGLIISTPISFLLQRFSHNLAEIVDSSKIFVRDLAEYFKQGYSINVAVTRLVMEGKYSDIFKNLLRDFYVKMNLSRFDKAIEDFQEKPGIPMYFKYFLESIKIMYLYGATSTGLDFLSNTLNEMAESFKECRRKLGTIFFYLIIGISLSAICIGLSIEAVLKPIAFMEKRYAFGGISFGRIFTSINIGELERIVYPSIVFQTILLSIINGKLRDGMTIMGIKYLPILFTILMISLWITVDSGIISKIMGWNY